MYKLPKTIRSTILIIEKKKLSTVVAVNVKLEVDRGNSVVKYSDGNLERSFKAAKYFFNMLPSYL